MKPLWSKPLSAVVLSVSLAMTAAVPAALASGEGTEAIVSQQRGQHALTPLVRVDVKSLYSERIQESTNIGVVIRLYNEGTRLTRVPDYELRVKTRAGVEYTLQASALNARSLQPKEQVDLSYMLKLDFTDATDLAELLWVEVDEYVYPKLETTLLSLPVDGLAWNGGGAADTLETIQWGETFRLPVLSDAIEYTPAMVIHEKTPQGPVTVVGFVAENMGSRTELVPDFRIDGRSDSRTYQGRRAQASVELKPGEKKYVHYGILGENNVVLDSMDILTQESFVQIGPDNSPAMDTYNVGRLRIALPASSTVEAGMLPTYTPGTPIRFDPLSKLVDKDTEVSLVDLSMNESESAGYNTIIAKFVVTNKGERTVALPFFEAELSNAEGFRYTGTRQITSVEQLAPKLSYMVNYSFAVPSTEKGEDLLMKLQDGQSIPPYRIPIGGFKTAVAEPVNQDTDTLMFYPFQVKLHTASVSLQGNAMGQFSYKLKLDLGIETLDDAIADANSTNMKVELVNSAGRVISTQTMAFTGPYKLIDGSQDFVFQNLRSDQFEWPLTVKIYESIQTPTGEANRLLKTVKQ